jgi:colanic acid/amylovoran biosynthesis glycosyltransferase
MACGLAVVTTRHSGLPEQVVDGVNGFVVEEGDWQALGERLVHLAAHAELLPAMSTASRRRAQEKYDASALIERQLAVYDEVAQRSARKRSHSG